ncbi:ABC1 kinase family protein [Clostridium weizhouense]|uniref:AarF/ABC1/UbiB kinase family protein n=1 Tax=Clostridium weizhouense TaxID=2859781 RepID=A0ABS7AR03_9CLOT|nr:AarF/UbiB family protein [Clostridium weizhouense]MBW6411095.1 AarF/ABC1/UbiB kinase family protein [Clostridium weizhouense]
MNKQSSKRFKEIIKVFAKYGFGYIFDNKHVGEKKSPKNLRKAFEELGPTFIKLGQILSTRPDIVSKEYLEELTRLQDSTPKEDFQTIKCVLEKSLNISIDEYFKYINESPIASASIAQVHEGVLKDNRRVVIKVQRPDISEKINLDISILIRIFKFTKVNSVIPIDVIEALQEIKSMTEEEVNFILEAKNIDMFRENNIGSASVYAPYIVNELLSEKVIILEKIDGFKINDLDMFYKNGYDNKEIAKKLALSYCKQIFKDGFFHGDPHPGNLLINCGKICFIDFGIVGRLNDWMKKMLNMAILAIATKDKEKLVDCILSVSIKKGKVNKIHLYDGVSYIFDTYLSTSIKNIKISILFQEIFDLANRNNIQLPRELISLTKTIIILEGVIAEIDPELEIIDVVIIFVKNENKEIILKFLQDEELLISLYSFGRDTIKIPSKTVELLNKLCVGEGKLQLTIGDKNSIFKEINRMINKVVIGILVAALIIGSSMIISNNIEPTYNGISLIRIIGYLISVVFILWFFITMIIDKKFYFKK